MCNRFPAPVCTLSYIQVHCYTPLRQLHADFGDFSNGVCHVKITIAGRNPHRRLFNFNFFFFFTFYFLQLYCPNGISPMGNSGCFPRRKPAATESRYPVYCTCWVFKCFHNPPDSDMDYEIFNVRIFSLTQQTICCSPAVLARSSKIMIIIIIDYFYLALFSN